MFYIILLLLAVILIFLLFLDFKFGRSRHHKQARTIPLEETTGSYHLYKNGSRLYEQLFRDISEAEKQVDVYFFLIENDYIAENFLQVLKNKAAEGVPVRLMGDRVASFKITKKRREALEAAGVRFAFAETPGFPYFFYRLHRRNHRKITVIDGKIGYVGGFNIGKAYIGETSKFGDWRDYHIRSFGPVVHQLHTIFLDDWYLATGEKDAPLPPTETEHPYRMRVVATDGVELEQEFRKMIDSAEREILIGTPYFIPTPTLQDALKTALKRNVSIHIMIPMKADHPFVKEAAVPYLKELKEAGADIRFFDAGFYHSKVIMIDGQFADIGTANFDRRSFFLNKEINTYVYDEAFIEDLRDFYFEDVADAVPFDDRWLKKRSLGTRINQKIAVLLRPFL
ncbi:cardiolipin synthase [Halobacillus litoralis]|uniref:cardiolipin synthase n=1 Tax=Halobacillus litoralis TaxID=45668 RepID=UPI001CD7DE6C|nr:cardiolipin synthase [Halobacillus litoralis]MCA1020882.1 cardiolipin synthase [Halobacillus litoralis]